MVTLALLLGYLAVTGHAPSWPLVIAYAVGLMVAGRRD